VIFRGKQAMTASRGNMDFESSVPAKVILPEENLINPR